jgi:hypothetical protein
VPGARYADLPPGIGFQPRNEPLRRDIDILGWVLGRILIEQEGEGLFESEEEVRLRYFSGLSSGMLNAG